MRIFDDRMPTGYRIVMCIAVAWFGPVVFGSIFFFNEFISYILKTLRSLGEF